MMSGIMAAHVISRIVSGLIQEWDGMRRYRAWLISWFNHDAQQLRELYRALDPVPIWTLIEPPSPARVGLELNPKFNPINAMPL
jgi:hypothetical protein